MQHNSGATRYGGIFVPIMHIAKNFISNLVRSLGDQHCFASIYVISLTQNLPKIQAFALGKKNALLRKISTAAEI